jgi:hypothetical protein
MRQPPFRNLAFVFLGRVFENVLAVALVAALARSGKEILGVYYLARAIAFATSELCELGLSRFTVRSLAGDASRAYVEVFGGAVAARVVTSGAGFLAAALVMRALELPPDVVRAALGLTGAFVTVAVAELFLDAERARENMRTPALMSAGYKLVSVGLGILGLRQGRGLDWVVLAILATSALYLAACIALVVARRGAPRIGPAVNHLSRLAAEVRPFAALTLPVC